MFSQEKINQIDKSDMHSVLISFSQQIREAVDISSNVTIPEVSPRHIIVCAMGGSAISGNILENYLSDKISIPITVLRDYTLPKWISKDDLVICNSYSGNTEETISCFREALARNATTVAVTSGGELEQLAKNHKITTMKIPAGLQPRASIAYLLMPLIMVVHKLGLYDPTQDIKDLLMQADEMKNELQAAVPTEKNLAKQIALEMNGLLPVVYGSGIVSSVARRFKTQLNENPKTLAFYDVVPESNHNDFSAWPSGSKAKDCVAVLLRYQGEHPRNSKRFDVMKRLVLEGNAGKIVEIHARGNNDLSKIMTLVHLTDIISYYLAILKGRDPTPVEHIEQLKRELKK